MHTYRGVLGLQGFWCLQVYGPKSFIEKRERRRMSLAICTTWASRSPLKQNRTSSDGAWQCCPGSERDKVPVHANPLDFFMDLVTPERSDARVDTFVQHYRCQAALPGVHSWLFSHSAQ